MTILNLARKTMGALVGAILAVQMIAPPEASALVGPDRPETQDVKERFSKAREGAMTSFKEFQEACAVCNEILMNEMAIKQLNEEIAVRAREIGSLNLYMEQIDSSGPTRRSSVWKAERQAAHARQMALRNEQQEARKQLSLRANARPTPAQKQQAINDQKTATSDLREKSDELRVATEELSKNSVESLGLDNKAAKILSSQLTQARSFLKEVEPVIRPQTRRSTGRK